MRDGYGSQAAVLALLTLFLFSTGSGSAALVDLDEALPSGPQDVAPDAVPEPPSTEETTTWARETVDHWEACMQPYVDYYKNAWGKDRIRHPGDYGRERVEYCLDRTPMPSIRDPDPGWMSRTDAGGSTASARFDVATYTSRPAGDDPVTVDRISSRIQGADRPVVPDPAGTGPGIVPVLVATGTVVLAGAVLYRRLTRDNVLDHDLRSRLVAAVEDEPAINAEALADRLGINVTTVLYHGRILEETAHLTVKRVGRRVLFYSRGEHDRVERELLATLGQRTKRDLLELVLDEPGIGLSEAARKLDKHRSTIKYHADALSDRGLVETRAEGRTRRLELADSAAKALRSLSTRPG